MAAPDDLSDSSEAKLAVVVSRLIVGCHNYTHSSHSFLTLLINQTYPLTFIHEKMFTLHANFFFLILCTGGIIGRKFWLISRLGKRVSDLVCVFICRRIYVHGWLDWVECDACRRDDGRRSSRTRARYTQDYWDV